MSSGRPNGALVTEVSGLHLGRALDVGCDPADYVSPTDVVAALLDVDWQVQI